MAFGGIGRAGKKGERLDGGSPQAALERKLEKAFAVERERRAAERHRRADTGREPASPEQVEVPPT